MNVKTRIKEWLDRMLFWLRPRLRLKLRWLIDWLGPDKQTQQILATERTKAAELEKTIQELRQILAEQTAVNQRLNAQLQRQELANRQQLGLDGEEALNQLKLLVLWEALSRRNWTEFKRARDELVKWLQIHLSFSPSQVDFLIANNEAERNEPQFQSLFDEIEQLITTLCQK